MRVQIKQGVLGLMVAIALSGVLVAQQGPTPLPLNINTATPEPTATPFATPVPPTPTPTDQGVPQLVVPVESGAINVRTEPDPEAAILGQINAGEQYEVIGQFFQWYQLRYDLSPNGTAYVFGGLVDIIGDQSLIVDLTVATPGPTLDSSSVDATSTFEALAQTPGFDLTLTASVIELEPPSGFSSDPQAQASAGAPVLLPTFTFPPNLVAGAPTGAAEPTPTNRRIDIANSEGLAPIVPIVLLASLGVIGLLLSTLRR